MPYLERIIASAATGNNPVPGKVAVQVVIRIVFAAGLEINRPTPKTNRPRQPFARVYYRGNALSFDNTGNRTFFRLASGGALVLYRPAAHESGDVPQFTPFFIHACQMPDSI